MGMHARNLCAPASFLARSRKGGPMDGWVDADLNRWKHPGGAVGRLDVINSRGMACPACAACGRTEVLNRQAGSTLWRCVRGHEFANAILAVSSRNFFF
jgi:hypothetical protein